MDFKNLKIGETYYIIKNTKYGPVMEKYVIQEKLGNFAVFVETANGVKEKFYLDFVKELMPKYLADIEYTKIKNNKALTDYAISDGRFTKCWKCGEFIDRKIAYKCSVCGWNVCPKCGSCKC